MRALSVVAVLALPMIAAAQGILIPRCPPPRPDRPIMECLPMRAQVVRTRSDVHVELRDRVLRYEVEERFVNRGGMIGEADYIFPLPNGAAFRDLKLSIDGQMVAGETMNATEARRIYEEIVRSQRDPALVEWMGRGMLRTRIFPINPGEERRVIVRFESVAPREGDAVRVDYFRGTQTPQQVQGRQWQVTSSETSRPLNDGRTSFQLTYRAGGELGEAYSPTHELDVERDDAVRKVSVRGGGSDVTLLVAMRRSATASISMLPSAVRDEQGYALITVTPPSELSQSRMSRDVTFVLDVSGSMSGRKLEQAKAAGRQLLRTLTPEDRFRVIDFSTDVRSFRDEFVNATDANVREAVRYLDALDATGSTNISGALDEALRGMSNASGERGDRLPLVLFITDGAPTVGEHDPAAIAARAARLRNGARVFTFGLGADVNVGLVEQLALEGRGIPHFVRPDENVERVVELLATRLRQPVLTDVRVSVDGDVRLQRMHPEAPFDVFAGQDLVVLARYEGNGHANVVVTGREAGTGRQARWTHEFTFPREERENAFVPRLWATQRLGWLTTEKRRGSGSTEIDDEIRRLGERFGIPTEFTSYLVQEPPRVASRRDFGGGVSTNAATGSTMGAPSVAAPAPQAAFEAARSATMQRAAKSVAAADMAADATSSATMKRGGTHMFRLDGTRWVDVRFKAGLQVYKVKAYSRSYFTMLERVPELREALMIGDKVLVAGKSVAIEIVDDAPELLDDELRKIEKGW